MLFNICHGVRGADGDALPLWAWCSDCPCVRNRRARSKPAKALRVGASTSRQERERAEKALVESRAKEGGRPAAPSRPTQGLYEAEAAAIATESSGSGTMNNDE